MKDEAYVFFATGNWRRCNRPAPPLRRRLRIAWRSPRRVWWRCLTRLVRLVSRSELTHCALAFDQVAIDPHMAGNRIWRAEDYVLHYPTLTGAFAVPLPNPTRLELAIAFAAHRRQPRRVWPTVLRWWTRGRWHTEDCVCLVADLLREGGVPVPSRIYTPQQLHNWLRKHRYEWIALADSADAGDGAGTDRAAG